MKRISLLFLICVIALSAFAQEKLSPSTRLFLGQRSGQIEEARLKPEKRSLARKIPGVRTETQSAFPIAKPRVIDGVEMIDAFIGLNGTSLDALKALGVRIQRQFKGFVTASIPVDKIHDVAALTTVNRVQVAQVMKVMTDSARSKTHVNEVIDGINNGLPKNYDGKGVVVGVIDTGIDPQHSAYDDEDGHSRIKRLYQVKSTGGYYSSFKEYFYKDSTLIPTLRPDNEDESHGTHTSTTAAGKKIHTSYGDFCGIAPGSDIYLCGLATLQDTYIANSVSLISAYADSVAKPCVISISLGGMGGPHDATDYISRVYDQATGSGKIIMLAAANQAGSDMYVYKAAASKASPLATIYEEQVFSNVPRGGYFYMDGRASAWARTKNVPLAAKFYVINAKTGAILWNSGEVTERMMNFNGYKMFQPTSMGGDTIPLNRFYDRSGYSNASGYLFVMIHRDYNQKYNVTFGISNLISKAGMNDYKIAYVVYPVDDNATTDIDMWEGSYYGNFEAGTPVGTYQSCQGNDKCSASSECYAKNVITVGAYVSKNVLKGEGTNSYSTGETLDDIASFSSYVEDGYGPDHANTIPWITAPGQTVVAGINHYDSSNFPPYITSDAGEYRYITKSDAHSYYGSMSGTSMATPCAAGIVALWLQDNPKMTPDDVRRVMKETAIHDSYTDGAHSPRFGHGKINARGGVAQGPVVSGNPENVDFGKVVKGKVKSTKIFVKASKINSEVKLTLKGKGNVYTVAPASLTAAQALKGDSVAITFSPTELGTYPDTLVLGNDEVARSAQVPLTGVCVLEADVPVMKAVDASKVGESSFRADWTDNTPAANVVSYTLNVNAKPHYTQVLFDDFSKATSQGSFSDFDNYTDVPGWSGKGVLSAGGGSLRLSYYYSGGYQSGYLITPALDLSQGEGKVTVKLNARNFITTASAQASGVIVSCGSVADTLELTASDSTYYVVLDCPKIANQHIQFTNLKPRVSCCLNDVTIYSGELPEGTAPSPVRRKALAEVGDSLTRTITGITDKFYVVNKLAKGETFLYKVKAVYADGSESEWSNEEMVTLKKDGNTLLMGDVNLDGTVNVTDVTTLINHILGLNPSPFSMENADVNKDKIANVTDVTGIINIILKQSKK